MAALIGAAGLKPQEELSHHDGLTALRRVLRQHRGTVAPALPRSLFPKPGTRPPRVETPGGWISPEDAGRLGQRRQEQREAQEKRRAPQGRDRDLRTGRVTRMAGAGASPTAPRPRGLGRGRDTGSCA
jgi:hypothetical protein